MTKMCNQVQVWQVNFLINLIKTDNWDGQESKGEISYVSFIEGSHTL